jgi:hypothetical protein
MLPRDTAEYGARCTVTGLAWRTVKLSIEQVSPLCTVEMLEMRTFSSPTVIE